MSNWKDDDNRLRLKILWQILNACLSDEQCSMDHTPPDDQLPPCMYVRKSLERISNDEVMAFWNSLDGQTNKQVFDQFQETTGIPLYRLNELVESKFRGDDDAEEKIRVFKQMILEEAKKVDAAQQTDPPSRPTLSRNVQLLVAGTVLASIGYFYALSSAPQEYSMDSMENTDMSLGMNNDGGFST